ncbi:putative DEAD-box ATP-dependent RNA helicase 29 [Camellia lanceoleosa]|nr:putative DEAD-box ATP-dependent RNA helicase 29 [Camellia lanceoleosa]
MRGDNRRFKGGKKHWSMPNAHVRSEIKDVEQVRKERQKKATRKSYMKSKSKEKSLVKMVKREGVEDKVAEIGKAGPTSFSSLLCQQRTVLKEQPRRETRHKFWSTRESRAARIVGLHTTQNKF